MVTTWLPHGYNMVTRHSMVNKNPREPGFPNFPGSPGSARASSIGLGEAGGFKSMIGIPLLDYDNIGAADVSPAETIGKPWEKT